ncbi:P-type ATPase [Tieghemostelium lacteum]|uniref:Phospholipid-transporting ATPase n=1 Tax=Tieghemostelium lacteum TaxID=361077 RepID=A0A151Z8B5_TIELA|nr:P-type ATPase [Tieghemostelium lacteum]|eukprot:KYQ90192.1 P-type ATPase [Tieghemostelium lacteum]
MSLLQSGLGGSNNMKSSTNSTTSLNPMNRSTGSHLEIPLKELKSNGIETDEIDIDLTPSNFPWYKKIYYYITNADQFIGVSRKIYVLNQSKNSEYRYCNNYVKTSKYTILSFIPKNLFEQFCRLANVYFLIISAFQLIPGVSPTGRFTTLGPLLVVLAITAVKEAYEDYRRHQQDDKVNHSRTQVLRGDHFQEIQWEELEVGDVVRVTNRQYIPADLLLLSSSEPGGICYIETANLDGETNLKPREALEETSQLQEPQQCVQGLQSAMIHCEHPNNRLYTFSGSVDMGNGDKVVPIGVKQVVLRGAMLRNTKWINGVVIFSGKDTKLMRNSIGTPSKRSSVERMTNIFIIFIFTFQLLLCGLCAIASGLFTENSKDAFYLNYTGSSAQNGGMSFMTFLILFNNLIPISLYVSMEVVKVFQAHFINNDLDMYHSESDTPALARTSNLNEELGQVGYIFSDKTGTLTQNKMSFKKCTIAGIVYGRDKSLAQNPSLSSITIPSNSNGNDVQVQQVVDLEEGLQQNQQQLLNQTFSHIDFKDPSLLFNLANHGTSETIREFMVILAVCHTVVSEVEGSTVTYQASSPDEYALVHAAKHFGFEFLSRTNKSITIRQQGRTEEYRYDILNILEFNSNRRRMSVIVRTPEQKIMLYCKGADSVIFERLSPSQPFADKTINHLQEFASEGLRTLCIARTEIQESTYQQWSQEYYTASTCINEREQELDRVAEIIEKNLFLLGATAIEDRLQDGVPETISLLRDAGIKIWVLTGDKQETAINIGFSCRLLTADMELIIINEQTKENCIIEINRKLDEINQQEVKNSMALIIDGNTLMYALDDGIAMSLLKLGVKCKSVICCRVSPLQKAQVVNLVRKNLNAITLSIGDGANDVNMIQTAHVGVGISGEEGLQAARSSDYAIAQFRFLARLLLVHGRYSYRRISKLICYCFYKNIALYLTQFCFTIFNGWSGQTYYERLTLTAYNVAWTFFPVLALGILDKDVSENACLSNPKLYTAGIKGYHFNTMVFLGWLLNGLYHSVVLFAFPAAIFRLGVPYEDGKTIGLFEMGTVSYTCVVLTVNLKLALETKRWTWINHLTTWGSIVIYFLWLIIFGKFFEIESFDVGSDLYSVIYKLGTCAEFYLTIIFVPLLALWRDFSWKYVKRNIFTRGYHIAQERDQEKKRSPSYHSNLQNSTYSFSQESTAQNDHK